jgi:hypothetical protein
MASSQPANQDPTTAGRLTGWFAAATVAVLGAAALAAIYGWSATAAGRAEFWTVAVPGLATGAGTLVLALAAVWTSRAARIDREIERRAAEELDAFREARRVIVMLHHRPAGATLTISNAGQQPILDVVAFQPRTTPDQHGLTYEWAAHVQTDLWPDAWLEHSQRALFVPPGGQFSIEGNINRVDADNTASRSEAGDGKRLEDKLRIAWTDSTGRRWERVSQTDPVMIARQAAGQDIPAALAGPSATAPS